MYLLIAAIVVILIIVIIIIVVAVKMSKKNKVIAVAPVAQGAPRPAGPSPAEIAEHNNFLKDWVLSKNWAFEPRSLYANGPFVGYRSEPSGGFAIYKGGRWISGVPSKEEAYRQLAL